MLGLRGRRQYSDQHSNRNIAPCVVSIAVGTKGEEDYGQIVSVKRKQLTEKGREAERSLMKGEKSTGPGMDSSRIPQRT